MRTQSHQDPGYRSSGLRKMMPWCVLGTVLVAVACIGSCRIRRLDEQPPPSASSTPTSTTGASATAASPPPPVATPPAATASSAAIPRDMPDAAPVDAVVVALGGTGSDPALSVEVLQAVRAGVRALAHDRDPLDAAMQAVSVLEDHPAFNAGRGSSLRFDGRTIEMDAALMDSEGRLGAVAAVTRVRNPIVIARDVANTPHPLRVGGSAAGLATKAGNDPFELITARARLQRKRALARLGAPHTIVDRGTPSSEPDAGLAMDAAVEAGDDPSEGLSTEPPSNVALVLHTPGGVFVSAASDGGRPASLPGQPGAVPVPGAAIYAGPKGAVAISAPANLLVQHTLARMVYDRMVRSGSPRVAVTWGLEQLPEGVEAGFVALNGRTHHIQARGPVAWAAWTAEGETSARTPEQGGAP